MPGGGGDDDTIIIGSGGNHRNNEIDTTSPIVADIDAMLTTAQAWKTFVQGTSNDSVSISQINKTITHLTNLKSRSIDFSFQP